MDYKSVQFAIAIYVLQSFCVFYVFDKHIISHGRSILNTPYYLTVTILPDNNILLLLAVFVLALPKTFAKTCSHVLPHNGLKFGTSQDAKL